LLIDVHLLSFGVGHSCEATSWVPSGLKRTQDIMDKSARTVRCN
jgi:hypothetical protein